MTTMPKIGDIEAMRDKQRIAVETELLSLHDTKESADMLDQIAQCLRESDEHENVAADAYDYAMQIMESNWSERAKRGVEIGTEGSLCDGIALIFARIKQLETNPPLADTAPTNPSEVSSKLVDDSWTIAHFIFQEFGDISASHRLNDDVVKAVRRIEAMREAEKGK